MEKKHIIFFTMLKGMVGYVILIWFGKNILNVSVSILMLLADGVVILSVFWAGLALVDVLVGTVSYTVGSVIHKKEKVKK